MFKRMTLLLENDSDVKASIMEAATFYNRGEQRSISKRQSLSADKQVWLLQGMGNNFQVRSCHVIHNLLKLSIKYLIRDSSLSGGSCSRAIKT